MMEYKELFIGIAVAFTIGLGFYLFINGMNTAYVPLGGTAANVSWYGGVEPIYGNISEMNDQTEDAYGAYQPSTSLISGVLDFFNGIRLMLKFIPNSISYAAAYFGVPAMFVNIALWTFIFVFILTLAYLLLFSQR